MSLVSDGGTIFAAPFTNASLAALSLFCWVQLKSVSSGQVLLGLSGTASGNYATALYLSGATFTFGTSQVDNTDTQIFAQQATVPSTGVWYPLCMTLSVGKSISFLSTQSSGIQTDAGSLGATTWNQIQFAGRRQNGGSAANFISSGGKLAEVAIWTTLLSAAEQNELVFGLSSPWNVQRESLLMYCPLRLNAQDFGPNHFAFLPSGSGAVNFSGDHPIMNGIRSPRTYAFLDVPPPPPSTGPSLACFVSA
jgi:hypothetical protein